MREVRPSGEWGCEDLGWGRGGVLVFSGEGGGGGVGLEGGKVEGGVGSGPCVGWRLLRLG